MDTQQSEEIPLGFVSIGRNEGDRLKVGLRAIQSLCPGCPIVYVDSGSTDDSVKFSHSLGIEVVELDLSIPFTAARARNAGFRKLIELHPQLEFVQFLDGDCELQEGWIDTALSALKEDRTTGIVSGRRIEKFPDASVYNALMDIEWNTPIGETLAVPGDMCVKVEVFNIIEGFTENIISAEDDDLCLRARKAGYKIFRLDAVMSKHDANITKLSQWYRRSKRGGHGYANINHIHGHGPERYFRKQLLSVAAWGGLIPASVLIFLLIYPLVSLVLALVYLLFISKTIARRLKLGDGPKIAIAYGVLIFTGKTPELMGAFQYWKNRLLSRKHELIEYK